MGKIFFQLAKRHQKEYAIFLFSTTIAVTCYYLFSSILAYVPKMNAIFTDIQLMQLLLGLGKLFIFFLLFLFIMMAFPFFFEVKEKDLEIFLILGGKKRQINGYLILEAFLLLITGFFLGTQLGIFLSKFFGQILVRLMDLSFSFPFLVSKVGFQDTAKVLFLIFIVTSLKILMKVDALGDLSNKVKKRSKKSKFPYKNWLGLGLIPISYLFVFLYPHLSKKLVNTGKSFYLFFLPVLFFIVGMIGTFLLLYPTENSWGKKIPSLFSANNSLLGVLQGNFFQQRKKHYQLLSLLSILAAFSFTLLGIGDRLVSGLQHALQTTSQADFQVSQESTSELLQILKEKKIPVQKIKEIPLKVTGGLFLNDGKNQQSSEEVLNLISETTYQTLQQAQPLLPKLTPLKNNEVYLFSYENTVMPEILTEKSNVSKVTVLPNTTFKIVKNYHQKILESSLTYQLNTLVVSDPFFNQFAGISYQLNEVFLAKKTLSKKAMQLKNQQVLEDFKTNWQGKFYYNFFAEDFSKSKVTAETLSKINYQTKERLNFFSRFYHEKDAKSITGLFIFLAFFSGGLFFIVVGSILMLHQLSLAKKNQSHYQLLKVLGAKNQAIKKLVYQENALLFGVPIIIGYSHHFFALRFLGYFLEDVPQRGNLWVWALLFAVYYLFYQRTCYHYYRWLKK